MGVRVPPGAPKGKSGAGRKADSARDRARRALQSPDYILGRAAGVKRTKNSSGTGINVSPRLRADRRALVVYFSNLQNAKNVSYSLTYQTSTQQEGAIGSLKLDGSSTTSQELLFGTCSKNVCRYHTGINNVKLEVSYSTKSGKKYLKRYKIKV